MSSTIERALTILGPRNVHSIDQVEQHFGAAFGPKQLRQLAEVPFTEKTLIACKDSHILFPGFPLSLLDLRDRHPKLFCSRKPAWYDAPAEATWATAQVQCRWYLLRKQPQPDSLEKTFAAQTALLKAEEEEVPRACEMIYALLLHYLAGAERLLPAHWVRCTEASSDVHRVVVGGFDRDALGVGISWDGYHLSGLGLASSVLPRKS